MFKLKKVFLLKILTLHKNHYIYIVYKIFIINNKKNLYNKQFYKELFLEIIINRLI